MKSTLMTAAIALALGVVWTAGPALAQTTGEKVKDKAVDAKDTVKEKARAATNKVKEKTGELKDKVKAKTERAGEKMEAKTEKADITSMQQALKDKGHDPGPVDGVMGPRTRAALRDFQRTEGLTATGRLDDETASKLGVRMSKAPGDTTGGLASPADPADVKSGPSAPTAQPGPAPEPDKAPPSKRNSP